MDEMIKKDRGPKYYNLKKAERQAPTEFKNNNSEITIRAADRGGGFVIMDANCYRTMMLVHVTFLVFILRHLTSISLPHSRLNILE